MTSNNRILTPNIQNQLLELLRYYNKTYKFHELGRIESIDYTDNTASVQLIRKITTYTNEQNINESQFSYKSQGVIPKAVIQSNYNAIGGLIKPLEIGSDCIVLFNDYSIDEWFIDGLPQATQSTRQHDINDAIVIPNIFWQENPAIVKDYNNDYTKLFFEKTFIELTDKIKIANENHNLKTLINQQNQLIANLINILTTIAVNPTTGVLLPTISSSLSQIQTQINTLNNQFNELLK